MQSTLKENRGNTKNISFQFHYGKCSQQKYSKRFYYYRCVTRGRRGGYFPSPFSKTGKRSQILGKHALIVAIYWLNFSIKMHFLSFCRRKNSKLFPAGPVFLVLPTDAYQSTLIPRKFPCPDKFLVNSAKFLRHHRWPLLHRAH